MNTKNTPRRGKTVDVASWEEGSDRPLSVLEVRQLLGIRTRTTINKHLKALGLFGSSFLNWQQVRDIAGMNCWLYCGIGNHSRRQYIALKAKGLESEALKLHGINLDKYLEDLKDATNQSTNQWQQKVS